MFEDIFVGFVLNLGQRHCGTLVGTSLERIEGVENEI